MLNQRPPLDLLFHALNDPTRRQIIERLSRGPASVSQLAEPFEMSLPAIVQHLAVLESSGIIGSEKVGRVRTCRIEPGALRPVQEWVAEQATTWERRLDRLGTLLDRPDELDNEETPP